jgi:hypothetical protein
MENSFFCSHRDEPCLRHEIMTPAISLNNNYIISSVTIGALEDLGYKVDYSKADNYTNAHINRTCMCKGLINADDTVAVVDPTSTLNSSLTPASSTNNHSLSENGHSNLVKKFCTKKPN